MSYNTDTTAFSARPALSERSYLQHVFAWMFLALAITTGVAEYIHASANVVSYFSAHRGIFFFLLILQLVMVIGLSGLINRITVHVAALIFCVYAALTGIVFSLLLSVYTTASVVEAFAGAASVFGGMAAYGFFTGRDLSGMRGILFGALTGLIVVSFIYIFTGGAVLNMVLGLAGVGVFSLLTAYDMQKVRRIGQSVSMDADTEQKLAIFGALSLYLDFVNLFLSLLRIFGGGRR